MSESALVFTENAAKKVYQLIKEEQNFKLNLRVYISGGGCSGFQYGFTFDEEKKADDIAIIRSIDAQLSSGDLTDEDEDGDGGETDVTLLVDPLSYQYLMGGEIDYQEDIQGARFVIRNPNAKTTCGCGSSFSV